MHLIVTSLLARAEAGPQIFILAPPTTAVVSDIHSLLCQGLKNQRPTEQSIEECALELLNGVQLLQYLDLPGLAESLSEVSQRLFEDAQRSGHDGGQAPSEKRGGSVLLIQGLSAILSTAERRSGGVQTCAILANLIRSIKHLGKTHRDLFVLVEVDVTSDGHVVGEGGRESSLLDTAFSSSTGVGLRVLPETALGSLLERGLDVMVCVHDGFGIKSEESRARRREGGPKTKTCIVEVVKDKIRGRVGEWCIWVQ